jgi:AcrR family transcriptional regulator
MFRTWPNVVVERVQRREAERMAEDPGTRGEVTRQRIVDTALQLFQDDGYERTTMRAIASRAGVSVGNAYYYFESKDHLVQAFYDRSQVEHEAAARPVLAGDGTFEERLRGVLVARIDTMQPYKEFAGSFFKTAADPGSPLSPFSPESAPARAAATALYAQALQGSDAKVPPSLRTQLPDLLWLYAMGIVLFWVHDRSPGVEKTYLLVDRTVPIVVRLVALSRYRVLRGVVDDVVSLVADLRAGAA